MVPHDSTGDVRAPVAVVHIRIFYKTYEKLSFDSASFESCHIHLELHRKVYNKNCVARQS